MAKTSPLERLLAMLGTYHGTTKTWLDPTKPPEEAPASARVKTILNGTVVQIEYATRTMGKRNKGLFVFGHDLETSQFHVAWMDTFHCSPGVMFCRPDRKATPKEISLLGDYSDGAGGRWGWRTAFSQPDPKTLVIKAFNVPPGDMEQRAIETRLKRVK